MQTLIYILTATGIISLISFIGVFSLIIKENLFQKALMVLVSFSAGALMGGAFLHLLPEAAHELKDKEGGIILTLFLLLFGFCIFFALEQFINWHKHDTKGHREVKPFSYLILVSDALHNFIDGLVIAAAFIISAPLGIATSIAVLAHEIPQEVGDFAILIYGGFKKGKALLLNFFSALSAVLGGVLGFLLSGAFQEYIIYFLPFAAGNFLYIAASDLIPEIKHKTDNKSSIIHFLVFLLGIGIMYGIRILIHG